MSIFEAIMLLCFGCAWPLNIIKTLRTRTAKGKSLWFLLVIMAGYIAGITHKLLYSRDIVLVLYCINLAMVITDTVLYFRFRKLDKQTDAVGAVSENK